MDKRAAQKRAWVDANREKRAAYLSAWGAANREKRAAQARARYAIAGPEKEAARKRAFTLANPDYYAAYRVRNRGKMIDYAKTYRAENREKLNAKSRAYYAANSAKHKTANEFCRQRRRERLAGRPKPGDGRCEVCGGTQKTVLHWDHDHATGAFRGWLCHGCNLILGHAKDDQRRLQLLIDYLAGHGRSAKLALVR